MRSGWTRCTTSSRSWTTLALFRTTSDEYFSRPDPLAPIGGIPFDLAFIDGLHLFEFALRDFIFAERHASARGMIVFNDVLPRTVEEAARERHTKAWTGDVFRVLEVLARFRPDVIVIPIDTEPTGLLAVVGLNPMDTTLADRYDEILSEFRRPDPQDVPWTSSTARRWCSPTGFSPRGSWTCWPAPRPRRPPRRWPGGCGPLSRRRSGKGSWPRGRRYDADPRLDGRATQEIAPEPAAPSHRAFGQDPLARPPTVEEERKAAGATTC